MNILLTGATGFLGKYIVDEIPKSDDLFTLSRNNGNYKISLENEIPNFNENFELVIHAAGKAHSVPKTDFEKKQFHQINVIGTQNLLKSLEKSQVPKYFVFISSVAVYGQVKGDNITEKHSLDAQDPYGISKIKTERILLDWCEQKNVVCTILRLPLLVGKNPPGNLGAMIGSIKKGYYFNIDRGKAKKSMVIAKDVANFIFKVMPVGGVYNLTDGTHPNFSQLSFAISGKKCFSLPLGAAKLIGKVGDIVGDKFPINSIKVQKITSELTFNDSKARRLLNWKPQPVLDYLRKEKLDH